MILAYSKRILLHISPVHPFGTSEIEARGLKFYQSNLRNLVGACETTAIFAFQWAMDAGGQGNSSHQAAFADAVARARQVTYEKAYIQNMN